MAKTRKIPERMCVGCRSKRPKREMIRVVRTPEGQVVVDSTGKKAGRGAYICPDENCLQRAIKSKSLERALTMPIGAEVLETLSAQIRNAEQTEHNGGE